MGYQVFLLHEDKPLDTEVYKTATAALDAEENYCYNELEAKREPPELRVCEVDRHGKIVREIE